MTPSLKPPALYFHFVPSPEGDETRIRKWSHAPFDGAVEYRPAALWYPIESAPESGDVLLYCEETGEQFVAFLGTAPIDGERQWVFARSPDVSFIVRDPTHWRPLPEPPERKEV